MALCSDDGIISTNDDATVCKRSSVKLGYWEDPFLECFARGPAERKPPEINRGYYGRVSAVNHLLQQFLELVKLKGTRCQVVNLGCGFDTLFWRLKALYKATQMKSFVDLDLDEVTMRKVNTIRHKPKLLSLLGDDIRISSTELHGNDYHLVAADIRTIRKDEDSSKFFTHKIISECGLDTSLPTIFLSECVLVYMTTPDSTNLLSWITSHFEQAMFINYEQVNLSDRFGEIMLENLRQRNCELLGLDPCKDLESQRERFLSTGWTDSKSWDMDSIYKQYLPKAEIERIEKLEFLDERDLLEQLLSHYCVVVATKGSFFTGEDIGF